MLWKQTKTTQLRTEVIYPGLTIARESATITWYGKDSKAGREQESFIGGKEEKAQLCSDWRVWGWGSEVG